MILHLDFESRSPIDLRQTGVYPYAMHPETDPWCAAYAFDDEDEVVLWTPGQPFPERIADNLKGLEIQAWNAQFERVFWWLVCCRRYGWLRPEREQFYCVAAAAAAMALPRKLEHAAKVLGLAEQKDDAGHRLMMTMALPRRATKTNAARWRDDAESIERLGAYCQQDVRTERAVGSKLRRLSNGELAIYHLDQSINDRGVFLDLPLIRAGQRIVEIGTQRANAELAEITGGGVTSVTKVGDLTGWLVAAGVDLDNVRKDTLRDLMAGEDLEGAARRVVELRSETAKSSTGKLVKMRQVACADDRARGLLLYHGAGTGRWAGRLVQPHNFPRGGDIKCALDCAKTLEPKAKCSCGGVARFIAAVLAEDYDGIAAEAPPLAVVSALLRSMLTAAPGYDLIAGDYSQIEARTVAWIAEQEDLVELFASGGKVYEETAATIYGVPADTISKDDPRRQIGKVTVLAAGFQMGWEKFQSQTKIQTGVDLTDELSQAAISGYRSRFPRIPEFWTRINSAAMTAVLRPGETTYCGRNSAIRFTVRGQFLWCVLPSGRPLAYGLPTIRDRPTPWGEIRPVVSYMGVDGKTKQWRRFDAYGGLLTENVVQAMARDLIAGAMVRLEKHGYRPVLSVHDEVVGEVPKGFGSLDHFLTLMKARPRWAAGLPVAVEGWQGERYRK